MKYELVFTAFNRPDYFRKVIDSWNQVRNISDWNVSFHIEPSNMSEIMADMAFRLNSNLTVHNNENRLGVLVNPWNALNTAFEGGADFVVIAEDDVLVSQDILEFFEWTSVEYETGHDVLAVNAFSQIGGGKSNQITVDDPKFSPLVWGIWKNRWETHIRDTWDKDYSSGNPDGSEAGWDWNINRIITNNNMLIVKPLQSRSDHIGEMAGTHMTPDLFPTSRGADFEIARGRNRYVEV